MSENPREREKTYRLAIRRPVTVAMLFLALAVFGLKSYQQLPIKLMPDISYPTLTVRTEFEGAAPEDVEKMVTRPIEETLSIITGLVEIGSVSSPGLSEIVLEFTWDTDMNVAQQDVRDRLDLFTPPREVTEQPVILRYDPTLDPVLRAAISGRDFGHIRDDAARRDRIVRELTSIRDAAERHVKSELEAEVGIARVLVKGGREEEIQVLVDAERLKDLGASLGDVVNGLAQQNINLSGGRLKEGKAEYLVRTLNEFESVNEIREALITVPGGQVVRLEDVADVAKGEKEPETIVRINGQEAVELEIFKQGDANTVEVCNKLKDLLGFDRPRTLGERIGKAWRAMREAAAKERGMAPVRPTSMDLRPLLPKDATLTLVSDQSRYIIASIRQVQETAIYGGLLALVLLFFFLRELKTTAIIGAAIPISVVATFIPMFVRGVSLNIMSLGGLALGIGMLVDNSIVVLESVFRCREEGDSTRDAAERGTHEVASAVTASTLTTIAVFLPIAFVEGIAGQLFRDLALTVTFSLVASLLAALFLIPMIASREKTTFAKRREAVWLLRAYREERNGGQDPITSLVMAGLRAPGNAKNWFIGTAKRLLGPAAKALTLQVRGAAPSRIAAAAAALLGLPFLLLLFLVHLVLQSAGAVFLTVLFAICLIVVGLLKPVAGMCKLILWPALSLFDFGFRSVRQSYAVGLRQVLRFGPAILIAVAILAGHAALTARALGRELIPPLKQGEFGVRMEAPPGTRLEETERRAQGLEELAMAVAEVETVATEIGAEESGATGNRGENIAQLTILLEDPESNARRQDGIIEALRRQVRAVTADETTFTLPTLFSFKTAVELQIRGDDLDELKRVGADALDIVAGIEGIKDAELSVKEGYPEVIVRLDRDLLAEKGLSPSMVAQQLRTEVQGDVATKFSRSGDKLDVRVRSDRQRLSGLQDLRMLSVTDGFPPIPLESVANIDIQDGPSEIRRIDQRQVVLITANVEGRDLGAVSDEIIARVQRVKKPTDYVFDLGGQNRELRTSYRSLIFALLLAVFLVYVVMACQFESVWHPALIMFSMPLAFIGVIYTLDWLDIALSVVVFIGGIVLAGIVVNNAIVLVDYINRLRRRGMPKRDAIVQACTVRFRPILMTMLTTVLGMMPMALWPGEGGEIRQPMAITVMAGLLCSTVLTLVVIPIVYDLFGGRDKP